MTMPAADLIEAVLAEDAARVAGLLAEDPSLASTRDAEGVSAIMLSRYRFDRATTDALLAADPDLDVFEAAPSATSTACASDSTRSRGAPRAFSADGFTALHFAAFFGKAEAARTLLEAGADVDVVSTERPAGPAPP